MGISCLRVMTMGNTMWGLVSDMSMGISCLRGVTWATQRGGSAMLLLGARTWNIMETLSWPLGGIGSLVHPQTSFSKCRIEELCGRRGRDESERHRAESQWIVAARPLCHLQYPVAYLSRLQRILPAAR